MIITKQQEFDILLSLASLIQMKSNELDWYDDLIVNLVKTKNPFMMDFFNSDDDIRGAEINNLLKEQLQSFLGGDQ